MAKKRPTKKKTASNRSTSKSETAEGIKERASSKKPAQSRRKKTTKTSGTAKDGKILLNTTKPRQKASEDKVLASEGDSVATTTYQLDENDLLDPGAQIVRACGEAALRHLEHGAELAREHARTRLIEKLIGPKRRFQPARAHIHWQGLEGQQIPTGIKMTSKSGRLATSENEAFAFGRITTVLGIGESGVMELPFCSEENLEDQQVDDSLMISKLRIEFSVGSSESDGEIQFPGLLWDLTPPISFRIQSVTSTDGFEMEWRLDHAGRLFVPIQRGRFSPITTDSMQPTYRVNIHCRVEPGEVRHLALPLLNVSEIEETIGKFIFLEIEPSTFETPLNRLSGVTLKQPFAGAPAVPEEDDSLWMKRASNAVRHGSRAVTPQDYVDLAADHVPSANLVEVAPTRVPVGCGFSDAVRLTVAPTNWDSLADFLSQSLVYSRRLVFVFRDKTPMGVTVVAGPPSIIVPETPGCSDPLWMYREFLVASSQATQEKVCRYDGVHWPLLKLANLRSEQ